jgi:hypothetical protein
MPAHPLRLALLALAACAVDVPEAAQAPPPPPALPGAEVLRVSDPDVTIPHRFAAADPLTFELHVPVLIPGRGLPPDATRRGPLSGGYAPAADQSVLQFELPTSPSGDTDEQRELASTGQFDPPRLCKLNRPCLWNPDDDGRWRAWRIRSGPSGGAATEVQLAHSWISPATQERNYTVVTAWLAEGQSFQPGDRVLLTYVGDAPHRATDWLSGDSAVLRPRLRYRPAPPGPADCPAADAACWVELDSSDVQGLALHPAAPTFLQVMAPLDTPANAPFTVALHALDAYANPAWTSATVTVQVDGAPVAPATFSDDWRATITVPGLSAGLHRVTVAGAPVTVIPQWVNAAGPTEPVRRVGDVHMHTGLEADTGFERGGSGGDHRGNFTRSWDALRYLREVAGHDFGALAEHGVQPVGWAPTSPSPDFQAGGPCAIEDLPPPGIRPDWWDVSQAISADFEATHPDFVTFPAYEWHGSLFGSGHAAALHRVVLYRDHRPPSQPHAMLPATQANRLPACLFRYLDTQGYDPSQVLVIPHMMYDNPDNDDWDLTYDPPPTAADSAADAARYQRVGEIFSARAYPGDEAGRLRRFEGAWVSAVGNKPYTFRYAWRDLSVVIGVIGSSDNHTQMPGADDPVPASGETPYHGHEPTGAAFVLTDPSADPRDGVYEGLYDRATYATSGVRAWLRFDAEVAGVRHAMGSELDTSACAATLSYDLATPGPIQRSAVWGTGVGQAAPWTALDLVGDGTQSRATRTITLPNPVRRGQPAQRRMYYLQAEVGVPPTSGPAAGVNPDGVWSSPIWITWRGAACGS